MVAGHRSDISSSKSVWKPDNAATISADEISCAGGCEAVAKRFPVNAATVSRVGSSPLKEDDSLISRSAILIPRSWADSRGTMLSGRDAMACAGCSAAAQYAATSCATPSSWERSS
jgi:hypothetical protein